MTRVGVGKRGYWGLLTRLLHSPVVVCSALPQLVVYCRAHVKQCQLASAELSAVGPPSWFCVAVGVPSSLRNGGGRVGLEGIGLRRLGTGEVVLGKGADFNAPKLGASHPCILPSHQCGRRLITPDSAPP